MDIEELMKGHGLGTITRSMFRKAYYKHLERGLSVEECKALALSYAKGATDIEGVVKSQEPEEIETTPKIENTDCTTELPVSPSKPLTGGIATHYDPPRKPLFFSVSVAEMYGVSDAIVYHLLQELQRNATGGAARFAAAIPGSGVAHTARKKGLHLTGTQIYELLGCFTNRQTPFDVLGRLADNKLIEVKGKRIFIPDTTEATDLAGVYASDAALHGFNKALLLYQLRIASVAKYDGQGVMYKKLSAADLAKVLPLNERTIRRHLQELLTSGVLVQMAGVKKFYRLG